MITNTKCFRRSHLLALITVMSLVSIATIEAVSPKYATLARKTRSANAAVRASAYKRTPQQDAFILEVRHAYIEQELGMTLSSERIVNIVRALACGVIVQELADDTMYTIVVPSLKTVNNMYTIDDLIQEIGRMYASEDDTSARAPRPAGSSAQVVVTSNDSALLADIASCCCNLTNVIGPDAEGICDAARWSTIEGIQTTEQSVIGWLKTIMIELRGFCQPTP